MDTTWKILYLKESVNAYTSSLVRVYARVRVAIRMIRR
jgi:hypothetical protein